MLLLLVVGSWWKQDFVESAGAPYFYLLLSRTKSFSDLTLALLLIEEEHHGTTDKHFESAKVT